MTSSENLDIYSLLSKPVLTSKSYKALECDKYIFFVAKYSTKVLVALAVEKIFGVKVEKVHIINVKGKRKMYRQKPGKRADRKKAIVTLSEGQKIAEIKKD